MKNAIRLKNAGSILIVFYCYLNVTWLLDLLPTMNISVPLTIPPRRLLVPLLFIAIVLLVIKGSIRVYSISTIFLLMGMYCICVTLLHKDLQQQPLYYYAISIMYPWFITYLIEVNISFIYENQLFNKIMGIISGFTVIYTCLIFMYRMKPEHIVTGSGEASIYYVLTLLPFVLSYKSKKRNILFLLIVIAIFIAYKRAAFIALIVGIFLYYFTLFYKKDERKLKLLMKICFLTVIIVCIYQIVLVNTGNDIIGKLFELQEDGGSGRSEVYELALQKFGESNILEKLIGIGYNGVRYSYNIVISGDILSAHNDFIEVLVDYGVIGIFIYMIFVFKIIKLFFRLKKEDSIYTAPMAAAIGIFFVVSMFSHLLLYPTYFMNLLIYFVLMEQRVRLGNLGRNKHV